MVMTQEMPTFPEGTRFCLHTGQRGVVVLRHWSPTRLKFGWWVRLEGKPGLRPSWNLPHIASELVEMEVAR